MRNMVGIVVCAFNARIQEAGADRPEFKATLVYKMNSRRAKTTEKLSQGGKKGKNKKQKNPRV